MELGPLAHLVERAHGMGEATGSNPVWSTKIMEETPNSQNNIVEDVIKQISAIRTEVENIGPNDYEIALINDLINNLNKGTCGPTEALKAAQEIRDRNHRNLL